MATINVGGLNPFGKKAKTLEEAVDMAMDNDTIKIHKNSLRLTHGIMVEKTLYIEGKNTTITVPRGQSGMLVTGPHNLNLSGVTFSLPSQTNGLIFNSDFYGTATLDHVNFIHLKARPREIFPSLMVNAPKQGGSGTNLVLNNCKIDAINANAHEIQLNDCTIGSFYRVPSGVVADQIVVNGLLNSDNTLYSASNKVLIDNLETAGQLSFNGKFDIHHVNLIVRGIDKGDGKIVIGKRAEKYLRQSVEDRKASTQDTIFYVYGGKDYLSELQIASVSLDDINDENKYYQRMLLSAKQANVTLKDTHIPSFDIPSFVKGGTLTMENVQDDSMWRIDGTELSNKQSTSQVFRKATSQNKGAAIADKKAFGALAELNSMIGLGNVKKEISDIIRTAKMNALRKARGMQVNDNLSLHSVFAGNAGTGKAEPVDALIHTPNGTKQFGQLKVGDYVFARNGQPTKVLGVYPKGRLNEYKVHLSDGRVLRVSDGHLFNVYDSMTSEKLTISLSDMMKRGIAIGRFVLPDNKAIKTKKANLTIDPYTMGVLLATKKTDGLKDMLEQHNPHHVFGDFIPSIYKNASTKQRMMLIRGMFDINGEIISDENSISVRYKNINPVINEDVSEVLHSLGIANYLEEDKTIILSCDVQTFIKVFNDKDKKRQIDDFMEFHWRKVQPHANLSISYVEKTGRKVKMQCIFVDNAEHLYQSQNYIVTHNTTVARLFGKALYENGVLKSNKFVECQPGDLVAGYVGQTAPKTRKVVESALDGVLFIDEAYTLASQKGSSFNDEAVQELIKDMEDHRDRLVVILAGYTPNMRHFFAVSNPGLKSRFANWIDFPDYTPQEMLQIMNFTLKKEHLHIADTQTALVLRDRLLAMMQGLTASSGNGRFIRNCVEKMKMALNSRLATLTPDQLQKMDNIQLNSITQDDVINGLKLVQQQQQNMNGVIK